MPTDQGQHFEKILKLPSSKWKRIPARFRGIGDELLRVADRATGFICDTCEAADVGLCIWTQDPGDIMLIAEAIPELLASGYLTEFEGRLYLTHHFERGAGRNHRKSVHMGAKRSSKVRGQTSQTDQTSASSRSLPTRPKSSKQQVAKRSDMGVSRQAERGEERRGDQRSISVPSEPREVETSPPRSRSKSNPGVRQVFEAWKEDTGHHRAKLDQKRTARIKARLKDGFTPEELIQAITHRRNDPFLMGENDTGRVYDGIQTLLRDTEQVERLLALTKPQRERDRTPDDPDWERKRKRVLEATERRIAREEAERRASLARQNDALRRFEESDAPSPAPGPKNAREGEPERLAEVFDIRALAARAGA